MNPNPNELPDFAKLLPELDAGVFGEKLSAALGNCALATLEHERQSEITVKIKLKRLGAGQIDMSHSLTSKAPTKRGAKTIEDSTNTSLHVSPKGAMSYHPFEQMPIFFPENM